ncbi:MAG: hypothetical protein HOW97_02335 [Catenulispora sp.]|nr:hypothetical protein [Catenulispora sp.]
MEIIDLTQKRREADAASATEYTTCACGEAWFELRDGAVSMTPDGSITAWTGKPHCISCGKPMT